MLNIMTYDFKKIRRGAEELREELVRIRRIVHENPELGFVENETAKLIKEKLDALGIPYKSEIAKTGIVATITGDQPGKTLAIRADMDALPIQENTGLEFASKNAGVMHACGHDTHVSCLLGAATLLNNLKSELKGSVKLLFQPAEEGSSLYDPTFKIAGGARPMVLEGAVGDPNNPEIDAVLALHIGAGDRPAAQVGKIGVTDGPSSGSADEFYITIKGKGGHASAPHNAVDPVFVAAQVYINIQGWLSRVINPMEPVVFTVGKIVGGFRHNIISDTCQMDCTLRTLNEEVRSKIKEELPKLISAIATGYNASADIEIRTGYPVGSNSKIMNDHIRSVFTDMYSADDIAVRGPILGAEDFYEFGFKNSIPISMFGLGGANPEKDYISPNHSSKFRIDEDALPIGTAVLAATAISYLNS